MGVGFHLTASYPTIDGGPSPEDWLAEVAAWLERHETEPLMLCRHAECDHGEPALFVEVHPGAEEVELCVPESGRLVASAKTSTAGPGYHMFVCDLLHRLGQEFCLQWDEPDEEEGTGDETGYFFGATPDTVRQEMLRWLGALAHVVTDQEFAEESAVRMVSMPMGYTYPEQEGILTPMGPRTTDWFRAVADEPGRGIDFFCWWPEGVGSAFFLGRALCRMWQDVRWRCPETDVEGELLMDVHHDLERAYRGDAAAPIPWREWAEILEYLGDHFGYVEFQEGDDLESLVYDRARRTVGGTRIGYRRGPVQVSLTGGWSITVAGELAEEWEEGGETWTAWCGARGCALPRGRSARARSRNRPARSSAIWTCPKAKYSSIARARSSAEPCFAATTSRAPTAGTCRHLPRSTAASRCAILRWRTRTTCRGRWRSGSRCATASPASPRASLRALGVNQGRRVRRAAGASHRRAGAKKKAPAACGARHILYHMLSVPACLTLPGPAFS